MAITVCIPSRTPTLSEALGVIQVVREVQDTPALMVVSKVSVEAAAQRT
jgi:hypothetical protein